jgi:hypothetical protein
MDSPQEIIYEIENRGSSYIYHWVILMLGGLRHIADKKPVRIYVPYDIPKTNSLSYHNESLNIIKDEYVYTVPNETYHIIKLSGEPLLTLDSVNPGTYFFLKNLYLTKLPAFEFTSKKYYITRKNSSDLHPEHKGKIVRSILNEEEMYPILLENGFDILQFENFSFQDKIKIFNTAAIIISPASGSLTFSIFANEKTKIIEILPENISFHNHYKHICHTLGISYTRYTDITTIGETPALGNFWNMIMDIPKFKEFLLHHL